MAEIPGKGPRAIVTDSSVVAETSEVQVMREALRDHTRSFIFVYELLQNAGDYNNFDRGRPSVTCILPDGSRIRASDLTSRQKPVRIEFANYILGDGLNPYQITNIDHDDSASAGAKLGKHGRGGTVAAAAALTDGHISSITYRSRTRKTDGTSYSWEGEGSMKVLNEEHQNKKRFVVEADYLDEEIEQTVVGINDPSDMVVQSLRTISNNFLPANPAYEHYQLAGSEEVAKIPALVTLYAGQTDAGNSFPEDDLNKIYPASKQNPKNVPRVEILSDTLLGKNAEEEGSTFEGGLKLKPNWFVGSYALNWSFYGFKEAGANYGYNPSRSSDSSYLSGNADQLIALTLKNCDQPEVFEKVITSCLLTNKPPIEAKISSDLFSDLPEATATALAQAWKTVAEKRNIRADSLITDNESIYTRLLAEGKNAVLLRSPAFAKALTTALNLAEATEAIGVKEVPVNTGEKMHYTRRSTEEHFKSGFSSLLNYMSKNNGAILPDGTYPTILTSSPGNNSFHGRFADLPLELRGFIENYLLSGGRLNINIQQTVFELVMAETNQREREATITIKRGTTTTAEKGVRISFTAENTNEHTIQERFIAQLQEEVRPLMNEDGSINWGKRESTAEERLQALTEQIKAKEEQLKQQADQAVKDRQTEKERLNDLAHNTAISANRKEEQQRQRLSDHVKTALFWPRLVRLGLVTVLLGTSGYTSLRIGDELIRRGVIELPSTNFDTPIGNVDLPVSSSGRQQEAETAIPAYRDRLPDRISLSSLENIQPVRFGEILQLPADFKGENGEAVGYFPYEQFVGDMPILQSEQKTEQFRGAFQVSSLEEAKIAVQDENMLVYKPTFTSQSLYPPEGWEIVNTYQVGGGNPVINPEGALFWKDSSQVPTGIIVVAKRSEFDKIPDRSMRITSFGNTSPLGEYVPNFDPTKAIALNDKLAGDPKLQAIHKAFLQEMMLWKLNGGTDKVEATEIAIKYLDQFARWSDDKSYSLNFQIDQGIPEFASIISVSQDPNSKYFCSVASNVTRDFLMSMGFEVANQPGYTLYYNRMSLYGDFAHQNNIVYLPDGRVLGADNTPFLRDPNEWVTSSSGAPEPSPLETQQQQVVSRVKDNVYRGDPSYTPIEPTVQMEIEQKIDSWENIGETAMQIGLGVGATALAFFALRKLQPHLKRSQIRRRMEKSVKQLSQFEFQLVAAVADHLANTSSENPSEFSEQSRRLVDTLIQYKPREHGLALQWLVETPQGRSTILTETNMVSPSEAFARLSLRYANKEPEVEERFPPILREPFLQLAERLKDYKDLPDAEFRAALEQLAFYVPREFEILYDTAKLIVTQEAGSASADPRRSEVVTDIMKSNLISGNIGASSYRLVNALYIQLTGEQLQDALEESKKK